MMQNQYVIYPYAYAKPQQPVNPQYPKKKGGCGCGKPKKTY